MYRMKHTVRIVGVTKAQHILQNLFGWKPIIISMSSQNRCKPAERARERKRKGNIDLLMQKKTNNKEQRRK